LFREKLKLKKLVKLYNEYQLAKSVEVFNLLNLKKLKKNLKELNRVLTIFSRFPSHIRKLENFSKGSSKFFVFKELLFLKQIGTSIILFKKKSINEEFRM
jgi:hypothetical protein